MKIALLTHSVNQTVLLDSTMRPIGSPISPNDWLSNRWMQGSFGPAPVAQY